MSDEINTLQGTHPEAWTLSNTDAAALAVFERKVLRKTFGPVRVGVSENNGK